MNEFECGKGLGNVAAKSGGLQIAWIKTGGVPGTRWVLPMGVLGI